MEFEELFLGQLTSDGPLCAITAALDGHKAAPGFVDLALRAGPNRIHNADSILLLASVALSSHSVSFEKF